MKMTKKEAERQELLKEGYRIFADAVNYNDDELIAYVKVAKGINRGLDTYEDKNLLISQLIKAISTLAEKDQHVLSLRCGLNGHKPQTLSDIGKLFQLSPERIRQIESKSFRRLKSKASFYTISIIQQKKETELVSSPISYTLVEDLNFSIRILNCLKRAGIYTVEELINFPEDKLIEIRNLGKKTLEEVLQKKRKFLEKFS